MRVLGLGHPQACCQADVLMARSPCHRAVCEGERRTTAPHSLSFHFANLKPHPMFPPQEFHSEAEMLQDSKLC